MEVHLYSLLTSTLGGEGVNGQLQSTAALALTTKPLNPMKNRLDGLQSWSGRILEGINFLTLPGTEPRFLECSARRLVTTPTTLSRLRRREDNNKMDLGGKTWHGVGCIHLVQDRLSIRHFRTVQRVFGCHQTRRIFDFPGFSRRTLLHAASYLSV